MHSLYSFPPFLSLLTLPIYYPHTCSFLRFMTFGLISPGPSVWPLDWNCLLEPGGVISGYTTEWSDYPSPWIYQQIGQQCEIIFHRVSPPFMPTVICNCCELVISNTWVLPTRRHFVLLLYIFWLLHFFPLSSAMFLEPRTGNVDVPFRGKNSTIMGNFFS